MQLDPIECPHDGGAFGGIAKEQSLVPLSDTQIRNLKPKERLYKVSDYAGFYEQGTKRSAGGFDDGKNGMAVGHGNC